MAAFPLAIVLKGYPRLSETFIAQEILALERAGIDVRLYSMRLPTDPSVHPVHREIRAPVVYLPEYLHHAPLRVLRSWLAMRRTPRYRAALSDFLRDLRREPTRNRLRRFGQALVLAHELPADTGWLYAHFLHTPASVARYAATLRGLPWSVSAHAKDVWTIPEWEKREKLAACQWAVTCTAVNAAHLAALAPDAGRVSLQYHGLDLRRFPPLQHPRRPRDGGDPHDPVTILSVGRAVAKKGYPVLLRALAKLPSALHWRFVHIGGGEQLPTLKRIARSLGIDARITWMGAQPQERVLESYRAADLFALACRIAADGDRDGLPNVLMEAQSQELACVSTKVSAIPELICDGETGLLVPPDDASALADGLARLIRTPVLRQKLGLAGRNRVQAAFSFDAGIAALTRRFLLPGEIEPECELRSTHR